ncbi:MAG: MFS transporter [Planctomycetaceae bacterium]
MSRQRRRLCSETFLPTQTSNGMNYSRHDAPTTRPTSVRWVVLGPVSSAAASAYLTRYCISAANTTMQDELGFDNAEMGGLMSAFMLGYFLFQIPGGWLGNRFGTRAAFVAIAVCWSLCNLWTAAASLLGMLWASRFMLGVFQAGMTPLSAKIVKDWIPLSNRGMSSATIGAAMSLGGAFTIGLTGWLLDHNFGWREIFAAYSLVAIVWAILFAWFFRTSPSEHAWVNNAELALIEGTDSEGICAQLDVRGVRMGTHLPDRGEPKPVGLVRAVILPSRRIRLLRHVVLCFSGIRLSYRQRSSGVAEQSPADSRGPRKLGRGSGRRSYSHGDRKQMDQPIGDCSCRYVRVWPVDDGLRLDSVGDATRRRDRNWGLFLRDRTPGSLGRDDRHRRKAHGDRDGYYEHGWLFGRYHSANRSGKLVRRYPPSRW